MTAVSFCRNAQYSNCSFRLLATLLVEIVLYLDRSSLLNQLKKFPSIDRRDFPVGYEKYAIHEAESVNKALQFVRDPTDKV